MTAPLKAAAPRLLAWFRRGARDLPWRRTRDPYAIWVSEVMLQQTQVATVVPYFERWMKRFPTVRSLARARLDDVLKMWEGLGYYARARHLHRAARAWTNPKTAAEWRELPGVGEYTAAAIASIAHGEPVPVCDGNVRRVLARLLMSEEASGALEEAVPARTPGDFNQALMELGQRVCVPRAPRCGECPVSSFCRARAAGLQDRIPRPAPKKAVPHRNIAVGICRKGDRILVAQRPYDGLLGGLWQFPEMPRPRGAAPLATVRHRYSHFAVTLRAFECRPPAGRIPASRWVRMRDLPKLAWSAADRKILEIVQK